MSLAERRAWGGAVEMNVSGFPSAAALPANFSNILQDGNIRKVLDTGWLSSVSETILLYFETLPTHYCSAWRRRIAQNEFGATGVPHRGSAHGL